jgi:vancomycin resistance protein YoaR
MKKRHAYILFLAFLIIIISLVGCNKQNSNENSNKNSNKNSNESSNERQLKNNVYFADENIQGLKESQVMEKIKKLSIKINKAAKDAKLDEDNWELDQKERSGIKLNEEKTLEMIFNAKEGDKVKYITEVVTPNITYKNLKENIIQIGRYTTTIYDLKQSRMNNVELAADWLNNEKVSPGEIFSFNAVLGKRTKAKGYKKAPIIIKTKEGPKKGSGVGGGICQISSTLYNAVITDGIEIIERHPHSKKVVYVPQGQDATVSYNSKDFKFRNDKGNQIMIKVIVIKNKLTVKILENQNKTRIESK